MANKTSYELHHNFPKLADESGFSFNIHRPRMHVDWNNIRLIDIDNLIRERKFSVVEHHLNDILNCVLESEFDVRILNEGVLKMFRLSQLAVEYQQFCRQYLDRSVYVLKEEISSLLQELDISKRSVREKDEEIRKLRRKTKHSYRTPLPYGNDNIATMILKTLTNKGELFPSTSNGDTHQYNKCNYCNKIFLNQLYLKSHITRRHGNAMDIPQKDVVESTPNIQINVENNKMNEEIKELKNKLKDMESFINKSKNNNLDTDVTVPKGPVVVVSSSNSNTPQKETKDAEVSTNHEEYLLDKIEEWKKEEHEKYNKEIILLRTQIMETINSLKEKENEVKAPVNHDTNVITQLHITIREQGAEILALKQELNKAKLQSVNENAHRRKDAEEQMAMWTKRIETQSKQYNLLVEKLNNVAKEAQESRMQAEQEKERAKQLQIMLHESINKKNGNNEDDSSDNKATANNKRKRSDSKKTVNVNKKEGFLNPSNVTKPKSNTKTLSDRKTLEKLHQKAQELLEIGSMSSSSSDVSSLDTPPLTQHKPATPITTTVENKTTKNQDNVMVNHTRNVKTKQSHLNHTNDIPKIKKNKIEKPKIEKHKSQTPDVKLNGPIVPRSPMKVVRAKITEEVNNRLVLAGMDPLKSGLSKKLFKKQRLELQQQFEEKSKKNIGHEKVRNSILAYLDTSITKKELPQPDDYVSPDKVPKTFSLTSVLSNVKSKAMSLVKSTDINVKDKRKKLNVEVAKKAMSLLRTPPGSAHSSPATPSPIKEYDAKTTETNKKSAYDTIHKSGSFKDTKKQSPLNKPNKLESNKSDSETSETSESNHKYYRATQSSKSVEHLIKSPARRPSSADADYNTLKKYTLDNRDIALTRTQSAINVSQVKTDITAKRNQKSNVDKNIENNISDVESLSDVPLKKTSSDENLKNGTKQTKSVLKNASSTSSLNKKKVLFDMDAIQMKSVSASPSQSITEKSDGNEKYELGLINLDGEEWDISSIENEPLKNDTKIQINTRTSPKIAELKQTIESQLARRNDTPSTIRVGGVDVLGGQMRASSIGGSNTSLGSSILDESDTTPAPNHRAFVKSKSIILKDDSEIDMSEFSIEGIGNKNESF